ncbi:MAG: hypothetical protein WC366_05105 [Bacilli bacterium]
MKKSLVLLPVCMLLLAACGGNPSVSGSAPVSTPSTSEGPSASVSVEPSVSDTPRPVDYVSIPDVIAASANTIVTTRGYFMGHNNKTAPVSGVDFYNSLYIADGDDWLQIYKVLPSDMPANMVIGETVLEVTGKVAHYAKNGSTTYEIGFITRMEIVVDSQVEVPEFTPVTASTGALSQSIINCGYELEGVTVASLSANSYGNVTITFTVGSTTYTLYLDSRYTDVSVTAISSLVVGDHFSCKTFVGANTSANPATYQFVFALDFVRTAA